MRTDFDIIIVGGGLVGAAMACALANATWRVALIEAQPFALRQADDFDTRSIAINYRSQQMFCEWDLWQGLKSSSRAIEHIHVSDQGHLGMVRLHANQFFPHPFGYVCEHQKILQVLYARITQSENIQLFHQTSVTAVNQADGKVNLKTQNQERRSSEEFNLMASLVIAADGGNSALKRMLAVEDSRFNHGQTAFTANLQMQIDKPGWAFERFTATGPLALLPLGQGRYSLIFTCRTDEQEKVEGLNEGSFIDLLQKNLGYRLGRIEKLGKVTHFPLFRVKSTKEYCGRVMFIGNASHTLHPIAGQGFNLGLRDVWTLFHLLNATKQENIADSEFCRRYALQRQKDHKTFVNATDFLARLYSTHRVMPVVLRNMLATTMNYLPSLQNPLVKIASGL